MTIFPLTKDIQAFLLRLTASLERVDGAVAQIQRTAQNVDEAVTEHRQMMARLKGS